MTVSTRSVDKMCRSAGFALVMTFLSLGAIGGCSSSNDDNSDWTAYGSHDGLDAVDSNPGIYPIPQNITPFVGYDPRKLQF